jgi:nucleotide-binding universal stress UspA family protein
VYSIILAPVDGSARSRGVVEAALEIARHFNAHVHLFRSIAVPPEFPAAAHMLPDGLPEFLEDEARRSLQQLAAKDARVRVEPPDMTTARPWRSILRAAARIQADLIVIGSHGYGGWDRILGTTASKVVDRADISVLVVHEHRNPSASGAVHKVSITVGPGGD